MFFFSSRRRHTRFDCDWSSDVCSSDLNLGLTWETAKSVGYPSNLFRSIRHDFGPRLGVAYQINRNTVDRKSTRLNSSHSQISYAVFCLKKKKKKNSHTYPYMPKCNSVY